MINFSLAWPWHWPWPSLTLTVPGGCEPVSRGQTDLGPFSGNLVEQSIDHPQSLFTTKLDWKQSANKRRSFARSDHKEKSTRLSSPLPVPWILLGHSILCLQFSLCTSFETCPYALLTENLLQGPVCPKLVGRSLILSYICHIFLKCLCIFRALQVYSAFC